MATKTISLADLFLQLWLELEAAPDFEEAINWQTSHVCETLLFAETLDDFLKSSNTEVPADLLRWLQQSAKNPPVDRLQRALLVAQSIDRWYGPLRAPKTPPASHARASRQLYQHGRLNKSDAERSVILRRPIWGRYSDPNYSIPEAGRGPWDTFTTLFVIPASLEASDPDDSSKKRVISFSYQMLDPAELRVPSSTEDWKPKIGFVPLAEELTDIEVDLFEDASGHWYDTKAIDLGARAAHAIKLLCESDVEIIIFPEMVIHPDAISVIQNAVREYGYRSQLRLVLAGTSRSPNGGGMPFNEALVLNHRGQEIGRQRKLHRWNLDGGLCTRYDFSPSSTLPVGGQVREFITPGEDVLVLDSAFGRLAIMICEDLGRSEPGQWLRDNLMLDWLFTPILDSSIEPNRWMAQSGAKAAMLQGCRVVVANSVPLTHRQNDSNRAAGKQPPLDRCGIGICMDISDGKTRYHIEKHKLSSSVGSLYIVNWDPSSWESFPFPTGT